MRQTSGFSRPNVMSFRSRSQSSCAGWVAPWDIFSLFVEKTVAYSLSAGKAAALASDPLASSAGSPASGLLHRPAPTAGQGLLAGEAPWPLCESVDSGVRKILRQPAEEAPIGMRRVSIGPATDPACPEVIPEQHDVATTIGIEPGNLVEQDGRILELTGRLYMHEITHMGKVEPRLGIFARCSVRSSKISPGAEHLLVAVMTGRIATAGASAVAQQRHRAIGCPGGMRESDREGTLQRGEGAVLLPSQLRCGDIEGPVPA